MKPVSLQLRLVLSVSLLCLAALAGALALVTGTAQRRINTDYDSQLIADAHILWHMLREDLNEGDKIGEVTVEKGAPSIEAQQLISLNLYTQWRVFRIWRHGKLVAWTTNNHDLPHQPSAQAGFSELTLGAAQWRTYALVDAHDGLVVEAWENLQNRTALRTSIVADLVVPMVLAFGVLLLLLIGVIRWSLRDVQALRERLARRAPDSLEPIGPLRLSPELQPLLAALNRLLQRQAATLARERQLIDNTAHELRTPLAALRLQAELVARAQTPQEQAISLQELQRGVDRTVSLADKLLLLAQLDEAEVSVLHMFDAARVVQQTVEQYALIAARKEIELSYAGQPAPVNGVEQLLDVLCGILLDNAIKYTPVGGEVAVQISSDCLVVEDSGPGIEPTQRELLFERFAKLDRSQPGSGLGLAIAREICQRCGWRIGLHSRSDDKPGLRVTISFEPVSAAKTQ